MSTEIHITDTKKNFNTNNREFLKKYNLSEVQKHKLQDYTNTNYRTTKKQITELPIKKIQIYKLQKLQWKNYRIFSHRNEEIQITEFQEHKLKDYTNRS